jgi:hypothetical protein
MTTTSTGDDLDEPIDLWPVARDGQTWPVAVTP